MRLDNFKLSCGFHDYIKSKAETVKCFAVHLINASIDLRIYESIEVDEEYKPKMQDIFDLTEKCYISLYEIANSCEPIPEIDRPHSLMADELTTGDNWNRWKHGYDKQKEKWFSLHRNGTEWNEITYETFNN